MVLTDLNRSSFDPAALKLRMCIEPEYVIGCKNFGLEIFGRLSDKVE